MNEERKRIMDDCRARFAIARTVTDEVLKGDSEQIAIRFAGAMSVLEDERLAGFRW